MEHSGNICYDLPGFCSSRLQHGLLKVAPVSALLLPVGKHRSTFQIPAPCAASGSAKFRLVVCWTGFPRPHLSTVVLLVLCLPSGVNWCCCHCQHQLGFIVVCLFFHTPNFWVSKNLWLILNFSELPFTFLAKKQYFCCLSSKRWGNWKCSLSLVCHLESPSIPLKIHTLVRQEQVNYKGQFHSKRGKAGSK